MNHWYCYGGIEAILKGIGILGVGAAENDAAGVVLLRSGKMMVLRQKMDRRGKRDTCGMLRAGSTGLVWSGLQVPL